MCLQFLGLLKSPSSLLAQALPTLGSASSAYSVNSKTIGVTSRISNTAGLPDHLQLQDWEGPGVHTGSAHFGPAHTMEAPGPKPSPVGNSERARPPGPHP